MILKPQVCLALNVPFKGLNGGFMHLLPKSRPASQHIPPADGAAASNCPPQNAFPAVPKNQMEGQRPPIATARRTKWRSEVKRNEAGGTGRDFGSGQRLSSGKPGASQTKPSPAFATKPAWPAWTVHSRCKLCRCFQLVHAASSHTFIRSSENPKEKE